MAFSTCSPVLAPHGCVACGQPLAAEAGLRILRSGGNAADAAVAVAACMNVTQPCSTGVGGDCFCLFYDAANKKVHGVNGSGRASSLQNLSFLKDRGYSQANPIPDRHALNVTVPGAVAGWIDTINKHGSGKLSVGDILQPAIDLAENGYPVAPITAHLWDLGSKDLKNPHNLYGDEMLLNGNAPKAGEIMTMPYLATTLKTIAEHGKAGFYEGRIAEAIVECVTSHGGIMAVEDLRDHVSTYDDPIKTCYRGYDIWEIPPNGQGITALMALNILEAYDFSSIDHNSAKYLHLLVEAMQLSFADTIWHCSDPNKVNVPVNELLSKDYAAKRRALIKQGSTTSRYSRGNLTSGNDTVYFCTTDIHGNACSFINSNYMGFGTALVPKDCGFTLHNRGAGFSLDPSHPNVIAASKRPYHTIIPGMATMADSGDLYAAFGVMGGYMQPQGHVQVLLNMIDYGMDPQEALNKPRFCIGSGYGPGGVVSLEEGVSPEVIKQMSDMGHKTEGPITGYNRKLFGRGQVIVHHQTSNGGRVWWAGSDNRGDGQAIGY